MIVDLAIYRLRFENSVNPTALFFGLETGFSFNPEKMEPKFFLR